MKNTLQERPSHELTDMIIEATKRFMSALEKGSELSKLEQIRDEVKQLAEALKQKEAAEIQQQNVEKNSQAA